MRNGRKNVERDVWASTSNCDLQIEMKTEIIRKKRPSVRNGTINHIRVLYSWYSSMMPALVNDSSFKHHAYE